MPGEDLLARVRSLDPIKRFQDGDESIEATLECVLEKRRLSETARRRVWGDDGAESGRHPSPVPRR